MTWQQEAKSLGIKYVGRKKVDVLADIEAAKAAPAPEAEAAPAEEPAPVPDVSNHSPRCSCDVCRSNRAPVGGGKQARK